MPDKKEKEGMQKMVFIGAVCANDDNLELLSDVVGLALNCYQISATVATSTSPANVFDVHYNEQLSEQEDEISKQCLQDALHSLQELEARAVLYPDDTGTDRKTLSEIHFLEGKKVVLNGSPVVHILRFHWQ